jgi:hypothetical protein
VPALPKTEGQMYKVTITQSRPNLEYEKQLQDYREWERGRYNANQAQPSFPTANIQERILECELTDEEYAKVKRVVIETV